MKHRPASIIAVNVYKIVELVGVSSESWEDAAATAIKTVAKPSNGLRFGEVVAQEAVIDDQGQVAFRTRLSVLSSGGDGV
jgi:flavin-binding protein dodecin